MLSSFLLVKLGWLWKGAIAAFGVVNFSTSKKGVSIRCRKHGILFLAFALWDSDRDNNKLTKIQRWHIGLAEKSKMPLCKGHVLKLCKSIALDSSAENSHPGNGHIRPTQGSQPMGNYSEIMYVGVLWKNEVCEFNVSHCSYSRLIELAWSSFGIPPWNPNLTWNSKQLTRWNSSKNIRRPSWLKCKTGFEGLGIVPRLNADCTASWGSVLRGRQSSLLFEQTPHPCSLPKHFESALWWKWNR